MKRFGISPAATRALLWVVVVTSGVVAWGMYVRARNRSSW